MGEMTLVVSPFLVGMLAGWVFRFKAHQRVSDLGHQQHFEARWALGLWGGLQRGAPYFTPEGWRYRNLAIFAPLVGMVVTFVLLVLVEAD